MSSAKGDKHVKFGLGERLVFLKDDSNRERTPNLIGRESKNGRYGNSTLENKSTSFSPSSSSSNSPRHIRALTAAGRRADSKGNFRSRTSLGKFSERDSQMDNVADVSIPQVSKERKHIKSALRSSKETRETSITDQRVQFADDRIKGNRSPRSTILPKIKVAFSDGSDSTENAFQKDLTDINSNLTDASDQNHNSGVIKSNSGDEDKMPAGQSFDTTAANETAIKNPLVTKITQDGLMAFPLSGDSESDKSSELGQDRINSENIGYSREDSITLTQGSEHYAKRDQELKENNSPKVSFTDQPLGGNTQVSTETGKGSDKHVEEPNKGTGADDNSEIDEETKAKLQMIFWLKQKRAREKKEKLEKQKSDRFKKSKARKQFHDAIWKVRWIIRFKILMKNLSARKTTQSATEAHWHATNMVKEDLDKPLIFNKLFFAKDRAYDRVPHWAQEVLRKEPDQRTDVECRRIHVLLRGLKGMNRFTERIQLYMCKTAWYQSIDPQRVVLRNGHVGQQFYIIYSGSVFVNLDETTITGEKIVRTEAILGRGESFGEQSLLRNVLRTATISCREWCEFLVVEKDVFAEVCPKIFDEELAEKVEFAKRQAMFKTKWWREDDIKNLCFEAQIQEYKTNKVIVTNNLEDEWIYICMEGKCRVIKCLMLDEDIRRRDSEHVDVKELPLLEWEEDIPAHRRKASNQDQAETKEQRLERDKSRLLNSMGLKFMNEEKDTGPKIIAQDNNAILKKTLEGGVVSLDTLILQKKRETKGREFIYLEIANLNPEEVFDLFTILRPPDPRAKKQSSLLLVSSGAKMLRIRRAAFFKLAAEEAVDYALSLAAIDKYPSDIELLESYTDKATWDGYKQQVVDDVVSPLRQQARRSYVNKYMEVMNDAKRKQNVRLLSTLRRKERKSRGGNATTTSLEEYQRRRSSVYSKDSRIQIEEVDEQPDIVEESSPS
ncbi:cyclic nucleotide-binding domain-containing protein 2 [Lingula anatina]|uniref:Cyclic nucleotide-binding domain-containing protein 2 n=1 Tax=Lingula anatina TaxID=7574 RepID=A0A1S3HNV8_LINAN|nr:cyclic nucleotide-binding domain-containing protein 2 [Lingula anatina]|eukprot:XP_013387720.1 cyclic nucleotide-binding domain-containing protein 2 [Lingula anatina]